MRSANCLAAITAAMAIAGCATTGDPVAAAALDEIEQRLLDAGVLRIDYVITARGAVEALLHGDLVAQKPALVAVAAHGTFAGSEAELRLVSDGKALVGGNGQHRFEQPLPTALHEGMLIGLVRMGVLHNLAMLHSGAPPDATDGTARDWVEAREVSLFETNDATRGISFEIHVSGQPAGEARLWFDSATGLPVRREQVVRFDVGEMRVTEIYKIEANGMVGPCRFDPETIAKPDPG